MDTRRPASEPGSSAGERRSSSNALPFLNAIIGALVLAGSAILASGASAQQPHPGITLDDKEPPLEWALDYIEHVLGERLPGRTHVPLPVSGGPEGSETPDGSVVISSLPFSGSGDTCDNLDDHDEPCPSSSDSPDVFYAFTPADDISINVILCDSLYDTKTYILDSTMSQVACNDDACGNDGFKSELECVGLVGGETYHIAVDGWNGDCGVYDLLVEECSPCIIECPPKGIDEGEPCGDDTNGGCNSDPHQFTDIQCESTVCGTVWADSGIRDTDWYRVDVSGATDLIWSVTGETPINAFIIDITAGCEDLEVVASGSAGSCETAQAAASVGPGSYVMFTATPTFDSFPCEGPVGNDYVASLECGCSNSLSLEIDGACQNGDQVTVELWMRDLCQTVTGFQAFLQYNTSSLQYNGEDSTYTDDPFPLHIQDIVTAETSPGELRLDGSAGFGEPGADEDALLATLVFDVSGQCESTSVEFDLDEKFQSLLSFEGDPLDTSLLHSPDFFLDSVSPEITCPATVTAPADPGCDGALVDFTVSAVDDCGGPVDLTCDPPTGSFFPTGFTTVTCTATDACGNTSECMFDVEVTATNLICVDVELPGSTPTTRCIRFVADDCSASADVEISFTDHDADPETPVRGAATIEVPCGDYFILCAKDEQHTLWDTVTLSISGDGSKYEADAAHSLLPGDTDNDGDVDINDVTLLIAQFGGPEPDGGCPWDGTRGADFSNNGNVFSEDYSLLSPQWLATSSCGCTSLLASVPDPRTSLPIQSLEPWVARRVDLNGDGAFDVRDVRLFEQRVGLPPQLSSLMDASAERR